MTFVPLWFPMPIRILNREDVLAAGDMAAAVAVTRRAFADLSAGRAVVPQRQHLDLPAEDGGALIMPAFAAAESRFAVKLLTLYPGNPGRDLPFIQGLMLLYDGTTGTPIALMDGAPLTALRTGAASGAATDLLARCDAATLAMIGVGGQAEAQVQGVCAVRPIRRLLVFARQRERAAAFAERLGVELGIAADAPSDRTAVAEADIICSATTATEAVFADDHIGDGTHINAVGAYRPDMCEVPAATLKRARLVVDRREACLAEAGDILRAIAAGAIDAGHIAAELGEVVEGRIAGRENPKQVTVFKSVGNAVQDAAVGALLAARAESMGLGTVVPW